MINVLSTPQVWREKVVRLPVEWLQLQMAAMYRIYSAQSCTVCTGNISLSFHKIRFNSVLSLHLDRKPKQVICFLCQMATFSDLH